MNSAYPSYFGSTFEKRDPELSIWENTAEKHDWGWSIWDERIENVVDSVMQRKEKAPPLPSSDPSFRLAQSITTPEVRIAPCKVFSIFGGSSSQFGSDQGSGPRLFYTRSPSSQPISEGSLSVFYTNRSQPISESSDRSNVKMPNVSLEAPKPPAPTPPAPAAAAAAPKLRLILGRPLPVIPYTGGPPTPDPTPWCEFCRMRHPNEKEKWRNHKDIDYVTGQYRCGLLRNKAAQKRLVLHCPYCKDASPPLANTHMKKCPITKKVTCPVLRSLPPCQKCGAFGDNAHTTGRCPQNPNLILPKWRQG